MGSIRLNNAILEILLHIGNSFDPKEVANEALNSYIQQLDLAGIVLFENQNQRYTAHIIKPRNLKSNRVLFEIVDDMILNLEDMQKQYFDRQMPYSIVKNQSYYYIYQLKGFGFMLFVKNDKELYDSVHKALRQPNSKFANSLISCANLKKLRVQEKQMLQQSKLVQMGEMLSMIAHQWRQPLTAISAIVSGLKLKLMIGDDIDSRLLGRDIDFISDYTQHLSKTIDDFRGFFRDDKVKELASLTEIIHHALDIVKTSIENKNIRLITHLKCKKKFETYPSEVKQVILNIIKNSEDALLENSVKNPTITIKTTCINDDFDIVLTIQDNAGGVPKSIIDKIFDPYFSTKLQKDGTGLGLYMSKTIIDEHCNGRLSVANDEDGAVFTLEFNPKIG